MSEIKLNLIDAERVFHGTIHGSVADVCVAALSAEPETIEELEAALARYIKPDSCSPFGSFHSMDNSSSLYSTGGRIETVRGRHPVLDTEPWDAGIVVIDLAARIVASESTYSQSGPEGEVFYHDGHALTDVPIWYRVPDDWLFVNSVDAYQWSQERRFAERSSIPALDARPILFGRPLLEFIVNAYLSLPAKNVSTVLSVAESTEANDEAVHEHLAKAISTIHARWLLTPREALRGLAPRDVLLARRDFIDFDLHSRSMQWSLQDEGPPCLSSKSFAYRFASFGTHECVLYYDLVRQLLWNLFKMKAGGSSITVADVDAQRDGMAQLITTLDQIKTDWLESEQSYLEGRIPAIIIENERKRLPQAMRARDMIIDDDCPMCQMLGEEAGPMGMGVGFWHLDGSHMDDDFAFSFCKTRAEWEVENRSREEFDRNFNRKMEERKERIAGGEIFESDPFFELQPCEFEPD